MLSWQYRLILSSFFGEITLCSQVFKTLGGKLMCENKLQVYEQDEMYGNISNKAES